MSDQLVVDEAVAPDTESVTTTPDGTEAPVTPENTETTADGTQAPAEAKPEAPAGPTQAEVDAAAASFKALLDEVLSGDADGERDVATGHMSESLKQKIKQAYVDLPPGTSKTSARTQVKAYVTEKLTTIMDSDEPDIFAARTLFVVQNDLLVATGGPSATIAKTPVDPTEAFVASVTALYLAPNFVEVPEGVADDWASRVDAKAGELRDAEATREYLAWVTGDTSPVSDEDPTEKRGPEPEVDPIVKSAVAISRGKALGRVARPRKAGSASGASTATRQAYTGPKRDVGKHIAEAFADKPVGTWMSIGDITKFESQEYGGPAVSQGAVSARVYAEKGCTVPGIEAASGPTGKRGAKKVS